MALEMSLYDLNKSAMNTIPAMPKELLPMAKMRIEKYINDTNNQYYMFMCKELSNFTILNKVNSPKVTDKIEDVAIEIAQMQGDILSIDYIEENSNVEFWIRIKENNEIYVFLLFAYDAGVEVCS